MGEISTYQDLVEAIDRDGVEVSVRTNRKPPLHTRILRELYDLYLDQPRYVEFLAHYPLIPSDLAERIAQEAEPEWTEIAVGLAQNPRSSQPTLNRYCEHPSSAVRLALAANPNLTPKECQALAKDQHPFVRAKLATNPALPNPLQFILADDPEPSVRSAVATRKNLDLDVATHLSCDSDITVRAAAIHNWAQDPELLHLWAESDERQNQALLMQRTQPLEPALLETLRLSPHNSIRQQALENAAIEGPQMLWLAESDNPDDRIFLAEQVDLPSSIQRILARDSSLKVRRRLAGNTCIDASIALHIAASDDISTCKALAKNSAIQEECIAQLCTHPDDTVALFVAYRDDLTEQHRDLLLNHRLSPITAEHLAYQGIGYRKLGNDTAEALARSEAPSLRAFAAQSAALDPGTLKMLTADHASCVRLSVAGNASVSEQLVRGLQHDSDREVVFAAEENIARRVRKAQEFERDEEDGVEDEFEDEGTPPPFLKKITNFFTE
ncbi:MAG: hypothetical protein ACPGKS_01635 [Coraliomargarita sp.]